MSLVPCRMLLMMHQPHPHQPWRLGRCKLMHICGCAAWEPTVVNLGHTLRKQRHYGEARGAYERALGLAPGQPGTLAALGYTHHLQATLTTSEGFQVKVQGYYCRTYDSAILGREGFLF